MTAAERAAIEAAAQAIAASLPPLVPEQRELLAELLAPAREREAA